jgi:hypothetical protein
VNSWSFEEDINWSGGIKHSKMLLPLDKNNIIFPKASDEQKLAISQFMGLIVASTISQLEAVAIRLKGPTWDKPLRKFPVNPEFRELGEEFYDEEMKHSKAFDKYIEVFASSLDIEPAELKSLLPSTNNSALHHIYKLNSMAGGSALWWLVSAVEEESILFYNIINQSREHIDPLYYQVHRCHFEEEIRHSSYATMMIEIYNQLQNPFSRRVSHKIDFLLAEVLNMTWTFSQLIKVNKLKQLKTKNPFFDVLLSTISMLEGRSPLELVNTLFTEAPYISSNLQLSNHKQVSIMLNKYGCTKLPLPTLNTASTLCTA